MHGDKYNHDPATELRLEKSRVQTTVVLVFFSLNFVVSFQVLVTNKVSKFRFQRLICRVLNLEILMRLEWLRSVLFQLSKLHLLEINPSTCIHFLPHGFRKKKLRWKSMEKLKIYRTLGVTFLETDG